MTEVFTVVIENFGEGPNLLRIDFDSEAQAREWLRVKGYTRIAGDDFLGCSLDDDLYAHVDPDNDHWIFWKYGGDLSSIILVTATDHRLTQVHPLDA